MLKILDINPFAEAMFYYFRKANEVDADKSFPMLLRKFSTHKEEIEKTAGLLSELEKLLDSKLETDERLLKKFFRVFKTENTQTNEHNLVGSCLASVLLDNVLMNHLDMTPAELGRYLKKWKQKDRLRSFLLNIISSYDVAFSSKSDAEEFSRQLKSLPISIEDKYSIMEAILNFDVTIREVLSLILPAAKIIKDAEGIYKPAVDEFRKLYEGKSVESIFNACFASYPKLPDVDIVTITPSIFRYDISYAQFTSQVEKSDDETVSQYLHSEIDLFIGFLKHIIKHQSIHDEIMTLSENMKTLADSKRIEMLLYLRSHKAYGKELCNQFDLNQPTMFYHIQKLLDAGFVNTELNGARIYYSTNNANIRRALNSFADKFIDTKD